MIDNQLKIVGGHDAVYYWVAHFPDESNDGRFAVTSSTQFTKILLWNNGLVTILCNN
jgi:hypothetical protein